LAANDAEFVDYLGTCWITDTKKVFKIRGNDCFQLGIDPPTGASASAVAGGTLPDGTYQVYAGYARKVSGTNVLYSQGQSLGAIVLGSGNNTVRVSLSNSADAQVNNKVIWMTDADGALTYFYYETDNNTTTTIDVANADDANTAITYNNYAVNNEKIGGDNVPVFEHIHAFNGYLWGSKDNVVYYSLQNEINHYDMERFYATRRRVLPYQVTGIFDAGGHLYFNTPSGIIMQPQGKPNVSYIITEKSWHWHDMNTVCDFSHGKIGLTNNGIRKFNGETGRFDDYVISRKITPEIDKIYAYTTFRPAGAIVRNKLRTEYHLTYCDESISNASSNARLVLNLDALEYYPEKRVRAPWEKWDNGANWMVVRLSGTMYQAQSHATAPKLYRESTTNSYDNGIYLQDGTLGGATSASRWYIKTRSVQSRPGTKIRWNRLFSTILASANVTLRVHVSDGFKIVFTENTLGKNSASSVWGTMEWGLGYWAMDSSLPIKNKLPLTTKGKIAYLTIEQLENDIDINIQKMTLAGIQHKTRST